MAPPPPGARDGWRDSTAAGGRVPAQPFRSWNLSLQASPRC